MTSSIFAALATQKIEAFCASFAGSRELFYDNEEKRLRHSAEFGNLREDICADFLKLFLPAYLNIGSGFLINSFDQVSTQCDLVVFDYSNTPLIEDSKNRRFYPSETVAAIGEVKSVLQKQGFLSALVKLSKAKQIRRFQDTHHVRRNANTEPGSYTHHFDGMASFLICEKLDFNLTDITADIAKHYDANDIELAHRHNLVLSIEDGIFCYKNHLLTRNVAWMYPVTHREKMHNLFVAPGEGGLNHFNIFTSYIFSLCSNATIFLPDISQYNGPSTVGHYQSEN